MKNSDYNNIANSFNLEKVDLKDNEYIVVGNYENMLSIKNEALKRNTKIEINNKDYYPKYEKAIHGFYEMTSNESEDGFIVLPDNALKDEQKVTSLMIADYKGDKNQIAAHEELPMQAAELAAAAYCFGEAGCTLAVVELPDAGLAAALPKMPVCAVTAVGPDGVSRSVERLAALAGGVMRKDSICVTAPEQPKAVLSELVVAAGKCGCELVVPDPEDITFLEAEQFASRVDYGGYTVPLAFLGRHAAGNAAMAVELGDLLLCGRDSPRRVRRKVLFLPAVGILPRG